MDVSRRYMFHHHKSCSTRLKTEVVSDFEQSQVWSSDAPFRRWANIYYLSSHHRTGGRVLDTFFTEFQSIFVKCGIDDFSVKN